MKTARKGFTLIELMVVIVIIGVLAAIAIPKLFGMTARAKAAELGPAAGTWVKLQQGYRLETESIGDFDEIGYTPPNSKVFDYAKGASTAGLWSAGLQKDVTLNNCGKETSKDVQWKLEASESVDCAEYSVEKDTGDKDCEKLTKIQDISGVEKKNECK